METGTPLIPSETGDPPVFTDFDQIAEALGTRVEITVELAGTVWQTRWFDSPALRKLVRAVPAGHAELRRTVSA